MMFSLAAQLQGGFSGTFSRAQQEIAGMQKEIAALAKAQSDVSAYQKQQVAVDLTQKKLEMLRKQYENMQEEMKGASESSSELKNKMLGKQLQIDTTSAALEGHEKKLKNMGEALRAAGVDTGNLGEASANLAARMEELNQAQEAAEASAGQFGESASEAFSALSQAIAAAGIGLALKQVGSFSASAARAAMDFEAAMVGVEKTTDMTGPELAAMASEIKALSAVVPAAATDIAAIAENAGQLGIEKENIVAFTRVMADLGVSTNLTGEQAAQTFAKFANITQMPQEKFSNLGSTIVALGNNLATTESDIASMALNLASAGRQAGMSEADILGFAAALSSVGMEAEAGGTAFSRTMNAILVAVETGSDRLEDFANVAGMSAESFAQAWRNDAAGALTAFTSGLADTKRHGKSTVVLLEELGFTNVRLSDSLRRAAGAGELFSSSIALANESWAENTALADEAALFYGTANSQMALMKNAFESLKIAIGDNFTPVLKGAYSVGASVLGALANFAQKAPALVRAVSGFAAVFYTATAALTAYTVAVKLLAVAKKALGEATLAALGPIAKITAIVGLVVAGIAALSAVAKPASADIAALSASARVQYYRLRDLEAEYAQVSAAMGETSVQAQILKAQMDEAAQAYSEAREASEQGALSARELAAAIRDSNDALSEARHARQVAFSGIASEAADIQVLAERLDVLSGMESQSASAKQEMLAIVSMLNKKLPELGLEYDSYSGKLNKTYEAVIELSDAESNRAESEVNNEALEAAIARRSGLADQEAAALLELFAARKLEARAREEAARADKNAQYSNDGKGYAYMYGGLSKEGWAAAMAGAETMQLEKAHMEAAAAAAENSRQIDELSGALADYKQAELDSVLAQEKAMRGMAEMEVSISGVQEKMTALAKSYADAYEAALKSVAGQFKLWDEAEIAPVKDAEKVNEAIEGQAEYWREYNENIATLSGKFADIDGLREMLASFADGSKDSAAAIAGMAAASDEDLAEMAANWEALKKEQQLAAEGLAEIQTEFSTSMEAIKQELGTTVEAMNLGSEAKKAGTETIKGFLKGAEGMLPSVQSAFAKVGAAGLLGLRGGYSSTFTVAKPDGSHAQGLPYVPFDGYLAMLHKGEQVLTAVQAQAMRGQRAGDEQAVTFAPQFAEALSATLAKSAGRVGGNTEITISPQYHIAADADPGRLGSALAANNDNLRALVRDALAEIESDAMRGAYR